MGPTASGNTDLAIALSQHLPIELISVDAAVVYRGMDIGSAKPTKKELADAPHKLIDIRDPSQPYSSADFCADAEREIIRLSLALNCMDGQVSKKWAKKFAHFFSRKNILLTVNQISMITFITYIYKIIYKWIFS